MSVGLARACDLGIASAHAHSLAAIGACLRKIMLSSGRDNMHPFRAILFVLLLSLSFSAHADWGRNGVAINCDKAQATFTVAPVVELSSEARGVVPVEAGFSQLPRGSHELRCTLRTIVIVAQVRVLPAEAGACMGAGYVSVDSLAVGDDKIIAHPKAFNWQCPGEDILVRLVVAETPSVPALTTCTAKDWKWDTGFSGIECTTKRVPP